MGGFLAAVLLSTQLALPDFTAQVREIRDGQCLGNGFDQEATIVLSGHDISYIVARDACVNEDNGIESVKIYTKDGLCECPQYQDLAKELFAEARTLAWEQNREQYAQALIAQLKLTKPQLGKDALVYITNPAFVPEGDAAHLSYTESKKGNLIHLYTYEYLRSNAKAKVYVDAPPYGVLDAVAEQSAGSIDDAYRPIRKGHVPLRTPSAEEKRFYEQYFKDVSTGRVSLYGGRDPKDCVDPWICRENPILKK
jgi:hypothetical protein